jgi:lipopolysaccharide transport system ATP-binding protein
MQVRLAFAVAAHLQPEILLVDEVLAVGDAAFQQKCLGKMAAVGQSGRTILFVSHNMAAVSALCQKGVVVNAGQIHTIAEVNDAIRSYLDLATGNNRGEVGKYVAPESGTGTRPRILRATVESELGNAEIGFPIGAPLTFRVTGESRERLRSPVVGIRIDNTFGQRVTTLHPSHRSSQEFPTSACGRFEFSCRVADLAVVPGEYFVTLALEGNGGRLETIENAMNFTVRLTDYFGTGAKPSPGIVVCREDWRLDQ